MWSLGVLLFILVVGRPPCRVASDEDPWFSCIKRGNKAEMDEFWSKHLKASKIKIDAHAVHFRQLIEGLLQVDPMRRLEAAAVVKHPWICTVCPTQEICQGLLRSMMEQLEKKRAAKASSHRSTDPELGDGAGRAASSSAGQQAMGGATEAEAASRTASRLSEASARPPGTQSGPSQAVMDDGDIDAGSCTGTSDSSHASSGAHSAGHATTAAVDGD